MKRLIRYKTMINPWLVREPPSPESRVRDLFLKRLRRMSDQIREMENDYQATQDYFNRSLERLAEFEEQTGCSLPFDDHAKMLWKVKYGEDFPDLGDRS